MQDPKTATTAERNETTERYEAPRVESVVTADDVTGPYDVIARVEAGTVDELGKLVIAKIQDVEGITRTLTCPIAYTAGE